MSVPVKVQALVKRLGEECGLLPDDADRGAWKPPVIGGALSRGLVKYEWGCSPLGTYGLGFFLTPSGWELAESLGVTIEAERAQQRAHAIEVATK